MAGNPQLDSNPFGSLDFTIAPGQTNSILLNTAGAPSANVFSHTNPFDVGSQLEIHGTFSSGLHGFPITLTFRYFRESLETSVASPLGAPKVVPIGAGTLGVNKITFPDTLTREFLGAGTLAPGLYKITCVVTFTPSIGMNAFAEGPIIEVF